MMNITHTISASTVQRGYHVYVRQGFRNKIKRQGIILAGSDLNRHEKWLVIFAQQDRNTNESELHCVSLEEFMKPSLKLRQVLYNQGHSYLHHVKLLGTSYIELKMDSNMIVNNVKMLYNAYQQLAAYHKDLKELIGSHFEKFSYVCCTTNSKDWTIKLEPLQPVHQLLLNNETLSDSSNQIVPTTAHTANTITENPANRHTHHVEIKDLKPGDHIYALRKGALYEHHGIVIAGRDIHKNLKLPDGHIFTPQEQSNAIIEDLMVIENNKIKTKLNIRFVTLAEFAGNYRIRRVLYGMNRNYDMFRINTKLSSKCYLEDALDADQIIDNARFLYYLTNGQMKTICPEYDVNIILNNYNLFLWNCEHFAHMCSTNENLIKCCDEDLKSKSKQNQNQIENKKSTKIIGESQQVKTAFNWLSIMTTFALTNVDKFVHYSNKILSENTQYSIPALREIIDGSETFNNCLTTFANVAGPMIGVTAAISCAVQIIFFIVRYLIYKKIDKCNRTVFLTCGLAIRGRDCIEGIFKAIMANGLGLCFSLLAGAISMLIPIPVLNIVLSFILSTIGFMIGHYITGVVVNFIHRYHYFKEKKKVKFTEN